MNHKKQHVHVNDASVDERFTTLPEQRSLTLRTCGSTLHRPKGNEHSSSRTFCRLLLQVAHMARSSDIYIDAAPLTTQMSRKPRPKRMKHMDNPKSTCSRARGGRHCNPFPSTDGTIESNRRFNPFHFTDGTIETNRRFPRSCR